MLFWPQRVSSISKFVSTNLLLHGQVRLLESSSSSSLSAHSASAASTLWFIKVVCTLCIQQSHSLALLGTDYFKENLNPFVAFGVIYHINSRLNNPDLAFRFFHCTRLSLNIVHLEPTFELMLRSLCRIGLHDSAMFVYECTKDNGVLPQGQALELLVSSFASAGKFRFAEEVLIARAEMCNQREEVVSSFVYNNFLSMLIGRNRVDEAIAFFRGHVLRLRSFCPDTCSFNIVMRGLCQVGRVEKAFEFFDVMRSYGCHPDAVSYNTLVNGLCRVGEMDRAEEFLREVKVQYGFSPDVVTYTSVISGFCKSGKMEVAAALLDEMINNGIRPNLVTFNVIIDGFGKNGLVSSAMKMYERMVSSGSHPDVVTFTSLIDCHCRLGELEEGMKLWNAMNGRKVSPNLYTFSVLTSALCRENRLNEARDLLRQLNRREDIVPPAFIYNPVIDGFCKAGNVDEANAIIAQMEEKGCIHDKMTFTILILGHCMKGRMSEAVGIYNNMLAVGCAPDNITISSLVSCLRKAGMAREANAIKAKASNVMHSGLSASDRTTPIKTNMKITMAV